MIGKYGISFTKAVASGNDFVIIDNTSGELDARQPDYNDIARNVSRRRSSVGADGLLVLESSSRADIRMRIINPDGTEVDMCGNGARCAALYVSLNGWPSRLTMETRAGVIEAEVKGRDVKLKMSEPKDIKLGINIGVGSTMMPVHSINTGVPHVVHVVDDIEKFDVFNYGRKIREHTVFAPEGTNADFAGSIGPDSASVRTYERGVEDETPACGTGAVATAVVLGLLGQVKSPVKIRTRGGETLTVYYKIFPGNIVKDVYLEGEAAVVFDGRV
jgi:diaminopimelate epimerase